MIDKTHTGKQIAVILFTIVFITISIVCIVERNFLISFWYIILGLPCLFFERTSAKLYLTVYNFSVLVSLFFYYILIFNYGVPYYLGGSDDMAYENTSKYVLLYEKWYNPISLLKSGYISQYHNSVGYVITLAALRKISECIGEFHSIVPKILNSFVLALSTCLLYKILRLFFEKGKALIASYSYGLYPILLYFSAHSFRDVIIAFLFLIVIYRLEVKPLFGKYLFISLLFLIVCSYIMMFYRSAFVPILILLFLVRMYLIRYKKEINFSLIMPLLIFSFFFFLYAKDWIISLSELGSNYSEYRLGLSQGISRLIFTIPIFPFGFILRYLYMIFPFLIPSDATLKFLFLGQIFQYFLIPFLLLGSWQIGKKHSSFRFYILFIHVFILIIALTTFTNRQLTVIYPFFIATSIIYMLSISRKRRIRIIGFEIMLFLFIFTAYLFLKI